MFRDDRSANTAAYLLAKAGAEGLSQRRLLALMYLNEREHIIRRSLPVTGDQFMLTEHGPVMKQTHARITGGLHRAPGAHHEWDRIAPATEPAVVADAGVAYATRTAPAANPARVPSGTQQRRGEGMTRGEWEPRTEQQFVLRNPQPPPRSIYNGAILDRTPYRWTGRDEGFPYLGALSRADHQYLADTWRIHGERDEDDLIQHMLELPERDDAVEGDLPLSTILKAVGYTPREIKKILKFAYEHGHTDSPDG